MMNKGNREAAILFHFLKERTMIFIFYVIVVFIFTAVAGLYGYENGVANMLYAAGIIAFIGFVIVIFDYIHYRNKCRNLFDALSKSGESEYYLPRPENLQEEIFHEIIHVVEADKRNLISDQDEKKRDMADYYTMWTHQIKTPISALNLVLQREDEDVAKMRKQAADELFRIEQYAEMALHYARLDSMSADMLFQSYEISSIIKNTVRKVSMLFIRSGLSLKIEEFECFAVTDEKWISFVIEQVLSNAIKYTTQGSIHIYGIDESGNRCKDSVRQIVIEDTGIGIAESDLPRIFERGFTGYNGRIYKKSTGIGLYLCQQIMDRLSHTIRVKSKVGEGTKVILGFSQE